MDGFDDEIGRRLRGAAGEVERSARMAPDTMRRAIRRHRLGLAARAATSALAVTALAFALPLAMPDADDRAALTPADSPGPTATEQPTTTPPPASPNVAVDSPTAPPPASPTSAGATTAHAPTPAATPAPTSAAPERPARPVCGGSVTPEATKPAGITVRVIPSSTSPREGSTIRVTVRVRNEGLVPVRYTTSGQEYDFWASDARGRVWQWSLGKAFTQPLLVKTLQPGEQVEATEEWSLVGCAAEGERPPRLAAGDYTVRALWVSDAEGGSSWWSDPVAVAIR